MNRAPGFLVVAAVSVWTLSAFAVIDANAADLIWVHQLRGQEGEGTGVTPGAGEGTLEWEDDQWRALLEGAGHNIIAHEAYDDLDFEPQDIETLNSADLVIFSRDTNSGDYNDFTAGKCAGRGQL